jgi:hypothetical protein
MDVPDDIDAGMGLEGSERNVICNDHVRALGVDMYGLNCTKHGRGFGLDTLSTECTTNIGGYVDG